MGVWLLGAIGRMYVDQVAIGPDHAAFLPMLVTVRTLHPAFAVDGYQEASASCAASTSRLERWADSRA